MFSGPMTVFIRTKGTIIEASADVDPDNPPLHIKFEGKRCEYAGTADGFPYYRRDDDATEEESAKRKGA